MNRNASTGPLTRPFARTVSRVHSFASLKRSVALICSLARSLTHFLAHGKVNDSISENDLVLTHSAWNVVLSEMSRIVVLSGCDGVSRRLRAAGHHEDHAQRNLDGVVGNLAPLTGDLRTMKSAGSI